MIICWQIPVFNYYSSMSININKICVSHKLINSKSWKTLMLNERSLAQHDASTLIVRSSTVPIFISSLRRLSGIWVSNISSLKTLTFDELILCDKEWKNEIIVQKKKLSVSRFRGFSIANAAPWHHQQHLFHGLY